MEVMPRPARAEERAPALRLLFADLAEGERERRVANALYLIDSGELDPDGLHVMQGPAGLVGALVCVSLAGASALVWPPQSVDDGRRRQREDLLVRHAGDWLRRRGVKLAQALLPLDEDFRAAPLERNGFHHVTCLLYLRHGLRPLPRSDGLPRLAYLSYADAGEERFGAALLRTYEGTLDCPELNGVRPVEQVLAGHRAQGRFDPERWWLALEGGRPVGVLLLSEPADGGDGEVAYVGVAPEARRRGLGRELMLKALAEARAAGHSRLTLTVDARNRPARQLYLDLGFEPFDRREVYLAVWR
jgi:ribosomal protein S18 acetylase RimI-like enzyme